MDLKYPCGEAYNFGGLEPEASDFKTSKVAILPVPYEATVSYGTGTGHGPETIISASRHMELFDEELHKDFSTVGICTLAPIEVSCEGPEKMVDVLTEAVREILKHDKFPVILGGEHSISLAPAKACLEKYPNMTVLQIDAHADLRDEFNGTKHSHAAVMARIREIAPAVQVGIRSFSEEEMPLIEKYEDSIFFAKDIHGKTNWIKEVVEKLSDDVYITFDIDGLDPSIMPATGTPEPGGLDYYTVLSLLKEVCSNKNVVGLDMVELAPQSGNHAPDFLAAKLVYKMIGYSLCK